MIVRPILIFFDLFSFLSFCKDVLLVVQEQIQILREKLRVFSLFLFCLKFDNIEEDKQYWRVARINRDYIVPERRVV